MAKFDVTTHCALCGAKLPTIPSGLAPAWCGYDLGPEYERRGEDLTKLCGCKSRKSKLRSAVPPIKHRPLLHQAGFCLCDECVGIAGKAKEGSCDD